MRLEPTVRTVAVGPLVRDALAGREPAASWYAAGDPFDPAAYRRKLEEVRGRFGRAERERAAAALRPTSARAAGRLARLVEEGGALVTTGQQAGLFTGPMLTLHKALSAVRLAAELERELETTVLPVFWVASEDHDWAEADHADVVDPGRGVVRLSAPSPDPLPLPMSERRLGSLESTFGDLGHVVSQYGDARDVLTWVRGAYREGATVAGAFGELLAALLSPFDVLLVDAADPALKAASTPALEAELRRAEARERLVAARTEEVGAAGYEPQVASLPGSTHLFFHGPAGRERLDRDGEGGFRTDSGVRMTEGEAAGALRADPSRFSPNVLLRPVVESAVLPTLAYVGGPAECAYFAQAEPLFRDAGVGMPLVVPRFSATVVPRPARRTLEYAGLEAEELRPPLHEVLERLARDRLPPELETGLEELREALAERFGAVLEAARGVDRTLAGPVGRARDRAMLEAAAAERAALRAVKRRDAELARRVERARAHLFPGGVPQERVLNVLPYLAADRSLLHHLLERMEFPWRAGVPA